MFTFGDGELCRVHFRCARRRVQLPAHVHAIEDHDRWQRIADGHHVHEMFRRACAVERRPYRPLVNAVSRLAPQKARVAAGRIAALAVIELTD